MSEISVLFGPVVCFEGFLYPPSSTVYAHNFHGLTHAQLYLCVGRCLLTVSHLSRYSEFSRSIPRDCTRRSIMQITVSGHCQVVEFRSYLFSTTTTRRSSSTFRWTPIRHGLMTLMRVSHASQSSKTKDPASMGDGGLPYYFGGTMTRTTGEVKILCPSQLSKLMVSRATT